MNLEGHFQERQIFSRLVPPNDVSVSYLHTLGRRDFDISFDRESTSISDDVVEEAINFIRNAKSRGGIVDLSNRTFASSDSLLEKQWLAFEIFLRHFTEYEIHEALPMIVHGTMGTGKSFLIHCIFESLSNSSSDGRIPLLLLVPTGIAAFNIHAKTIHSALKIPTKDMHPLQG